MRRHRAVAAAGEGLGLGLDLSLGPKDVGLKKTMPAAAELVLDLNVPAPLEEDPADRAIKQLGLAVDFPVVVDFRRSDQHKIFTSDLHSTIFGVQYLR
jgi:hypothetical protein